MKLPILPFDPGMTGPAGYLGVAGALSFKTLSTLRREAYQFFRWVWYNTDEGCSPAQMLAAMGNKAVSNFTLHYLIIQAIKASGIDVPESEYTPPLEYVKHADGTITLK